jgi:hypothetical protein
MLTRRTLSKALLAAPFILKAQQGPLRARVKIDTERVIGDIDPKIYGNFAEHLGRCIDGGIFEEGSPLSDAKGYRKDVLAAAKDLNVTQLRWPGGNFSSNYHWRAALEIGSSGRGVWIWRGARWNRIASGRMSSSTIRSKWEPSLTFAPTSGRARGLRRRSGWSM